MNRDYNYITLGDCVELMKEIPDDFIDLTVTSPPYDNLRDYNEELIGYSIIKGVYLKDLECKFRTMKNLGIVPTEKVGFQKFWAEVRKALPDDFDNKPCECAV